MLANELEQRPADKSWMLDVISTLCEGHEFFSAGYAYDPKQAREKQRVNNEDGFFSDIPSAMMIGLAKSKRKNKGLVGHNSEAERLERLEQQAKELRERMARQEQSHQYRAQPQPQQYP